MSDETKELRQAVAKLAVSQAEIWKILRMLAMEHAQESDVDACAERGFEMLNIARQFSQPESGPIQPPENP